MLSALRKELSWNVCLLLSLHFPSSALCSFLCVHNKLNAFMVFVPRCPLGLQQHPFLFESARALFHLFPLFFLSSLHCYIIIKCPHKTPMAPVEELSMVWTDTTITRSFLKTIGLVQVWFLTLVWSWASQRWCSPPLLHSTARASGKRRPQRLSSYQRF